MKSFAFQTIRPVVSRKKRGFSAHFGPGGAVPPPRVSSFSKLKRYRSRLPSASFPPFTAARHNRTRHFPADTVLRQGHPLRPAADAACRGREGDPGRPEGGRSAKAGADITRPTGPGRFAPMPRAPRGGRGTARLRRQLSHYRQAGSTGVQGV